MRTSASISNISAALVRAQAKFPPIVRTKTAEIKGDKANYKFNYAPLEEILHSIRPTLIAEGLFLMQGVEGFNLVTTLLHESGEFISHWMEMPHAYPSPRAFGSELSFRRRYSVTAVLGLASEEDDDGQAAERELQRKPTYSASGADVCREAYDKLTPEDKEHIKGLAANVVALLEEGRNQEAYGYLEKQLLDDQEKPALWSLLSSKQRSTIKKTGDQLRKLEPAT